MMDVKAKQLCTKKIIFSNQCLVTLTFGPKIDRALPRLLGSLCVEFHDDSCKGKAIMILHVVNKTFSVIKALWPCSFDPEINSPILPLMQSLYVNLRDRCTKFILHNFSILAIIHCDPDFRTQKSIRHILDSRGACIWSFMMIGLKRRQLCDLNILPHLECTDRWTDRTGWFQYTPSFVAGV